MTRDKKPSSVKGFDEAYRPKLFGLLLVHRAVLAMNNNNLGLELREAIHRRQKTNIIGLSAAKTPN